ncbi:RH-like protein [Pelecanus crispus]|uniref:Blood group Rh(D) polypeptide n=1 Tax=Pelecanus crispus TaxID=36300 RepID=A0A091SH54_PELCR|nr:PREDICTED: RH-like protein [Pelecanus crispus]KFQ57708.1 Blood group Rh(D) polypeptide [Pelecanus crispus]
MPSNYRNFRNSVPWLILVLEAVFIVLFYFLFPGDVAVSSVSYSAFKDVNRMLIFGFGFFLTFLKRYGFSSTGLNLLISLLGVQCSALIEGLLAFLQQRENEGHLERIAKAAVSTTAVVISTGAVLGKANPVQLILMAVVEIIVFDLSRWITKTFLQIPDNISMMHVHLFGAYFGLAVSSRFSEPSPKSEKNASTPKSDLLSMLGTLFLWVFWPSFNSVQAGNDKNKAICNTYFALAVSAVMAFTLSVLTTKDGKFRMTDIHSAVLAGGVTVGHAACSINYPWIAMILGLLASVIAILGSYCSQRCLNPALKIHDTSGIHFTFGLPGVLGALAHIVLLIIKNWTDFPRVGYLVLVHLGAFCLTISVALVIGFITGLILNLKLFKTVPGSKYFDDQFYWEFPHLAVGF